MDSAFFRSDNGGAYHSASTIGTLFHISETTGINIKRYDFSESQSGKGPCDRIAALVKRTVRLYAAENHRCVSAHEFAVCASSYGGNAGVSIVNGIINLHEKSSAKSAKSIKIPGIQQFFNFEYSFRGLWAWKAYKIGSGVFFDKSKFSNKHNVATFEKKEAYHQGTKEDNQIEDTSLWRRIPREQQVEEEESITQVNSEGYRISVDSVSSHQSDFSCTEDSCDASFGTFANLQTHLDIGAHKSLPERMTLTDYALETYKSKLERFFVLPEIPVLREAMHSLTLQPQSEAEVHVKSKGWALPSRKKHAKFNVKQTSFLQEKFQEGQRTGRKWDPHDVSREMMYATSNGQPMFEVTEYLNYKQIMGYFSREAARISKELPFSEDEEVEERFYMLCDLEEELQTEIQESDIFEEPTLS